MYQRMAGGSEQANLEATFFDVYQIMSSPLSSTHVTIMSLLLSITGADIILTLL